MVPFTVKKNGNKVWIGDSGKVYDREEILIHYLNMDMSTLDGLNRLLAEYKRKCRYAIQYAANYNENVHRAQGLLLTLASFFKLQPPYSCLDISPLICDEGELIALLNQHKFLFGYGRTNEYVDPRNEEELFLADEYGFEDVVTGEAYLHAFYVDELILEDDEYESDVIDLNRKIEQLFDRYITLVDDAVRVKNVYAPFLDKYNSEDKKKAVYDLFHLPTQPDQGKQLNASSAVKLIYGVDEKGELCRVAEYTSLGDFLYMELMEGLEENSVPRKCANCGRYFLQPGGYDTEYCDNIAPGEDRKTCKEVGAKNTFDQKVKTNPIWQLHQRAYKTHYARMKKKNMTQQEFLNWSEKAAKLRDQCLAGKVTVEALEAFLTEDLRYKKK